GAMQPPPTGSTAPAAPAQTDLVGPRPLPPIGPNSPVVTPQSIADTPYPVAQNALAPPPAVVAPPPAAAAPAAAPPAAAQPPAAPGITPPAPIVARGLTAEQLGEVPALERAVRQGRMTAAEADAKLIGYQKDNVAQQRQYALDVQAHQDKVIEQQRQAATQQREEQARAEAAAKAEREAVKAADPIQGTDEKANADRTLFRYRE